MDSGWSSRTSLGVADSPLSAAANREWAGIDSRGGFADLSHASEEAVAHHVADRGVGIKVNQIGQFVGIVVKVVEVLFDVVVGGAIGELGIRGIADAVFPSLGADASADLRLADLYEHIVGP